MVSMAKFLEGQKTNFRLIIYSHSSTNPEWWGAGMAICLELGTDLHMAQLMPLPLAVSCFSKNQIGFTFVIPAHPDSPRQRAARHIKQVCVCSTHAENLAKIGPANFEINK